MCYESALKQLRAYFNGIVAEGTKVGVETIDNVQYLTLKDGFLKFNGEKSPFDFYHISVEDNAEIIDAAGFPVVF